MAKEEKMEFPCYFPIKVFGLHDSQFVTELSDLILKHFPELDTKNIVYRLSKNNKYLALSVTVYATSKEQLDTLYKELSSHPLVKMAL